MLAGGILADSGLATVQRALYSPATLSSRAMSDAQRADPAKMHWFTRLMLGVSAAGVLTLLGVAASLDPSPQGFGTHKQLGFPDCTFVALYGMRCPSCGMTTSWAFLTHGRIWSALGANVGGAILGLVSLGLGPWGLVSAVRGRWIIRAMRDREIIGVAAVIILTTLLDWAVRLVW